MKLTGLVDHGQLGMVKYQVRELGDEPEEQVRRTLGLMKERVAQDSGNPGFVRRVRDIFNVPTYFSPSPSSQSQVPLTESVWGHTKEGIRFQRDEATGAGVGGFGEDQVVETIIRPVDMARYVDEGSAVGDCDDFSMYAAACLTVLGIPCEFVTVAADSRVPNQYSHVYVVAYPRDEAGATVRIPVDASHGEYCGWEVPNQFGKMTTWSVVDEASLLIGKALLAGALLSGLWLGGRYFLKERAA